MCRRRSLKKSRQSQNYDAYQSHSRRGHARSLRPTRGARGAPSQRRCRRPERPPPSWQPRPAVVARPSLFLPLFSGRAAPSLARAVCHRQLAPWSGSPAESQPDLHPREGHTDRLSSVHEQFLRPSAGGLQIVACHQHLSSPLLEPRDAGAGVREWGSVNGLENGRVARTLLLLRLTPPSASTEPVVWERRG